MKNFNSNLLGILLAVSVCVMGGQPADGAVGQPGDVQAAALRTNRSLVGYYLDNELNWEDEATGPGVYFNDLAVGDPNRQEVVRVLREVWSNVDGRLSPGGGEAHYVSWRDVMLTKGWDFLLI